MTDWRHVQPESKCNKHNNSNRDCIDREARSTSSQLSDVMLKTYPMCVVTLQSSDNDLYYHLLKGNSPFAMRHAVVLPQHVSNKNLMRPNHYRYHHFRVQTLRQSCGNHSGEINGNRVAAEVVNHVCVLHCSSKSSGVINRKDHTDLALVGFETSQSQGRRDVKRARWLGFL